MFSGWFSKSSEVPIYEELETPVTDEDFQRVAENGADKMLTLKDEVDGWQSVEHEHGSDIQLFSKKVDPSPVEMTKAVGIIEHSLDKILSFVNPSSLDEMKQGDPEIVDFVVKRKINDSVQIIYSAHATPFPVSTRELLYVRCVKKYDNIVVVSGSSINMKDEPVVDKRVRAAIYSSGWVIEPLEENKCRVTRILQLDPKGNIPTMIVNSYKKKTALALQKARQYLNNSQ